jgi:DNA-binding NarL/FixJ family response regulator
MKLKEWNAGRKDVHVSIVDSDCRARRLLANWIGQTNGLSYLSEHGSAEGALKHLPGEKPDIVLMDIILSGLDGFSCLRRLKAVIPETQFVILTVQEDCRHIYGALAAGAAGYLSKQTGRKELISALKAVRNGGSPMSSHIARKVVQAFHRIGCQSPITQPLSTRELEVLKLIAEGATRKWVAATLDISLNTVNSHVERIYEKLHVRSASEAVARFTQVPFGRINAWAHPILWK